VCVCGFFINSISLLSSAWYGFQISYGQTK